MLQNVVLFAGDDASGDIGLWETDGTAAGTFELAPIAGAAPSGTPAKPSGLAPSNLTVFGGAALFEGKDSSGNVGLWTTNGTAAGTMELTGIAGADASGLNPSGLTVFNNQVLFNGADLGGLTGLWTTNGTAAGTHELTGVVGAAATGLNPSDLTVFNNEVLFNGVDSRTKPGQPVSGLWVTNGTAAGTVELVPGTASASDPSGLNPYDMTVFGADVLFGATNASGQVGLWETDGTASGTHEITGISGANHSGLNVNDLTVLGGIALFSGLDNSGPPAQDGLWVTDGTALGTQELTGITDIHGVAVSNLTPRFLTAFKGEVLFNGTDSKNAQGLWVTDGTAAGTHEIFAGVGGSSDPGGLDPSNFEVFNGEVLFSGKDVNGEQQLWETDGKVGGTTQEVSGVVRTGGLAPFDLTAIGTPELTAGASTSYVAGAPAVPLDPSLSISDPAEEQTPGATLTGATVSISAGFLAGDVLSVGSPQTGITSSYNAGTGVLTLAGAAKLAAYQAELDSVTFASPSVGNRTITWSVTDSVDGISHTSPSVTSSVGVFTNNSGLDITLQKTSGQLALWQSNGVTLSAAALLGPNPGASWFAEGSGTFFSGDTSDLLWQNTAGSVAVWQMQNDTLVSGDVVAKPGPNWHVEATGDFNGDGKSDIVLQNTSGNVAIWNMNGGQISQASVVANPGPAWHIEGTGDFSGAAGHTDILLQNTNGNVAIWNMNGDQISQGSVVANPGPAWHIEGTGDFSGAAGHTDILLQNTNGNVAIWNMNGDQISQGSVVANPGPAWHIEGTGDFNQDGKTDIVLQNNNGSVAIWDMNGAEVSQGHALANPGPTWSVVGDGRHSSIS